MLNQSDRQDVVDTVHAFCRAFDLRDWSILQRCLAAELATDYSSFRGTPSTRLTTAEFIALRRTNLTGLITQHLALNHFVTFSGEHSRCRFDFIIHRWPQDITDSRFFHTFRLLRNGSASRNIRAPWLGYRVYYPASVTQRRQS